MADDEANRTESHHSNSPATPSVSNPGTPRSEVNQDVRATPPPLSIPTVVTATPPPLPIPTVAPTIARATPPLPHPAVARATPPLPHAAIARATPPLARGTPPLVQGPSQLNHPSSVPRNLNQAQAGSGQPSQIPHHQSKYASLLAVIEDMGRDIRPTYAGNRSSTERLKRSIVHARILVRECLMECERSARS